MLEAKDYANALALINRASIQGTEIEEVAQLKAKLLQAHKRAVSAETDDQPRPNPEPNIKYDPADLPMALVTPKS